MLAAIALTVAASFAANVPTIVPTIPEPVPEPVVEYVEAVEVVETETLPPWCDPTEYVGDVECAACGKRIDTYHLALDYAGVEWVELCDECFEGAKRDTIENYREEYDAFWSDQERVDAWEYEQYRETSIRF